MDPDRRVDMVRLQQPEAVYDVEEVLGRDVQSVFPTKAKDSNAGGLDPEAVKEMLGAKKFVTETELNEIKARRGDTGDGPAEPLKPLAEVLKEAKDKKQQAFEDMWKQMKTGKNRPLDEDEMEFLQELSASEAQKLREQQRLEQQELEAFRQAAAALADTGTTGDAPGASVSSASTAKVTSLTPQLPPGVRRATAAKPLIRAIVKPKAKPDMTQTQQLQQQQQGDAPASTSKEVAAVGDKRGTPSQEGGGSQVKRHKDDQGVQTTVGQRGGEEDEGGADERPALAGLLGDYGSGSDDD